MLLHRDCNNLVTSLTIPSSLLQVVKDPVSLAERRDLVAFVGNEWCL